MKIDINTTDVCENLLRPNLVVFGCSFTMGNPACYEESEYYLKYKKTDDDLIWVDIVAKELNLNVLNFGYGGFSNDMILDSIIKNWNSINDGDIVIIEQSFTHRFEVLNPKKNELITVNPNMVSNPLFEHPFDKKETESISLTSVFVGSDLHKKRYNDRFQFISKMLYSDRHIKKCVVWDLENTVYNNDIKYEMILEQTNNEIFDHHWSFKGHRDFSKWMLNKIKQ